MNKKVVVYLLFFVLLFAGFLFAMNRFIPGFSTVKLPVLSYVQPFSFTNQEGKTITEKDVAGKVYVVEYFFTTCTGICPKMNNHMKQVYEKYKDNEDFRILSHTVTPDIDSVARMRIYADSLGANPQVWYFLTGSKDSLYKAARVSYLLDDVENNNENIEDQFIHTQFFALVDKKGQVRKIYNGLKTEEITKLEKDIHDLLEERTSSLSRFTNGIFNNNP